MKSWLGISALLLALAGLAGCSHYRLGTGSGPAFARLFIAPVQSDVTVPQAQVVFSNHLREAFTRDARVTLAASPAEADAILTVTLGEYRRDTTVARADDTGLARRYDIVLKARATLTDQRTGRTLFQDRPLEAKRGAFTDSGQLQAEYQNLPLLAEDLARAALRATLDTW